MSFNEIKEYNIPYKDKADGQIIDPVEWNANFIHIEDISDQNRQIINETFDSLLNDGANNILIDEAVTGIKENLKEVLIKILNTFNNYYTKNEANAYVGENTNELVETIIYSSESGTFTITKKNGDIITIDTNIEKIPASMALKEESDGAVYLVITNQDGSSTRTNVTSLIEDTIINSSNTINASAVTDGINKKTTYTLEIKSNSISLNHLTSEAVSKIDSAIESANIAINNAATSTTKANEANQSATAAIISATNAEDFAEQAEASKIAAQAAQVAAERARDEAQQFAGGDFVTNTDYREDTEKIIEHIDTRVIISEVEISNLTQEEAGRYANGWNKLNDTDLYYFYNLPVGENVNNIDDIVDLNFDLDSLVIAEECGLKSVVKTFDISTADEAKFLARIYAENIPSEPMNATMIIHKGGDFSWL